MEARRRSRFLERAQSELEELSGRSQLRELEAAQGVNFCSNDYLGLAGDPRLREAVISALRGGSPAGATGSRLLSGHSAAWEELESEFARYCGTEAALFFNSGYAANTGLFGCLLKPEDVVFSDSANHASIIDGIRLSRARKVIFPHLDLEVLETELRRAGNSQGRKLIAVESVFSMEGDRAPMAELIALGERYGAELIVDEAHATGVFGPQGRGLAAQAGGSGPLLAMVHTCGKALGSAGAFVAGTKILKSYLINHARPFIFSTALPPYLAAQIGAALRIAERAEAERAELEKLSSHFRRRLREQGFDTHRSDSQIVPVIAGENQAAVSLAAALKEDGFVVRAIRPPTVPAGRARLRFSLTAKHRAEDVERVVDSLGRARERLGMTHLRAG